MQEMQDLDTINYAIPTMLIDDDIRQIEQKQEANVAVLKTQTRRNEQNQRSFANKSIWDSIVLVFNIFLLVVQSPSEYSSLIQEFY